MSKAALYARFSSDKQREESVEGQLRERAAFAERKGYTVVKDIRRPRDFGQAGGQSPRIYADDRGQQAKRL